MIAHSKASLKKKMKSGNIWGKIDHLWLNVAVDK